jgi:hypothetical protein
MFGLMIAVERIEAALARSKGCVAGLAAQRRAFSVDVGPSGGPEILATIFVDDPFFGFWYGHIQRHPRRPLFVSQIVWTDRLINAQTVPLLFRRFHYWIKDRLEYQPCAVQSAGDAYAESDSLEAAADALILMIERFDIDRRTGFEGTGFEDSRPEIRITEVYGLMGAMGQDGSFPPVPMAWNN